MKIILASASQRRKELLSSLGISFDILPSEIDESKFFRLSKRPEEIAQKIALAKGLKIRKKIKEKKFLIISADTIVVFKNKRSLQILGKPENRKESERMLSSLKNRMHKILTGIVLINQKGIQENFFEESRVFFKNFTNKQMNDYLDTGTYLDRAGAYGIQDERCVFVEKFEGDYSNILGLPLIRIAKSLKKMGIKIKNKPKLLE